ncbi:leucine-rich repeat domain-containing protein [Enterococcus thailandicus]|uniref:leucine-rich repeat domain-containing protein n=1 Tax=Enterococcus thailandicus TaxID=417368 RepID=UPI003BC1BFB1
MKLPLTFQKKNKNPSKFTINGKKITLIKEGSFGNSRFNGQLTLPKYLQSIGVGAFQGYKFSGELILPDKLTSIGAYAFNYSEFSGELILPNNLSSIGFGAFASSNFTGNLVLPNNLSSIEFSAFSNSKFTGTLDISNVTNIGGYAFKNSSISTVKNDSLNNNNKTINKNAIKMADGSYYSIK